MTVGYRISSTAPQIRNDGNFLEIEPIHDADCPRASFSVSDGDPEGSVALVVELDIAEIGELRNALARLEEDLQSGGAGIG